MTAVTWLALAGLAAVSALPAAASGRVAVLAGDGRLRASTGARSFGRLRVTPAVVSALGGALVLLVAVRGGVALAVAVGGVLGVGLVLVRDALARRAGARGTVSC